VHVTNLTAFNAYSAALLSQEQIEMGVQGKVDITTRVKHMPNIKIKGLRLDKTVSLAGSGGLKGAKVLSLSMADSTQS